MTDVNILWKENMKTRYKLNLDVVFYYIYHLYKHVCVYKVLKPVLLYDKAIMYCA